MLQRRPFRRPNEMLVAEGRTFVTTMLPAVAV
jgi:hypothetical protein